MSRSRIAIREPDAVDADAYIVAMRAGKRFHHPWIVAPTDREAWDKLVAYGPFCNAYLGYWATLAYAGHGYMAEGMAGVLRHAFRKLRLHRVEANVQPANTASVALLERCGFRREGFSPRYLKVAGRWRDHERWATTVEDWRGRSH